jgi:hypothetical protein
MFIFLGRCRISKETCRRMPPSGSLSKREEYRARSNLPAQLVSAGAEGLCCDEGRKTGASIHSPPAGRAGALSGTSRGDEDGDEGPAGTGCRGSSWSLSVARRTDTIYRLKRTTAKNSQLSVVKLEFGLSEGLFYDIPRKIGSPVPNSNVFPGNSWRTGSHVMRTIRWSAGIQVKDKPRGVGKISRAAGHVVIPDR